MPPESPTPAEKPAPSGRKFPCARCGGRLDFDPSSAALRCPYCQHTQAIERGSPDTWENDLEAALERLRETQAPVTGHTQIRCGGCGAAVVMDNKARTDRCPYCATHLENVAPEAAGMIVAERVLPFALDQRQAGGAFEKWLQGLWFAPTALRLAALRGRFAGVYVPYWTFDSMTFTWYSGERGDDYQDIETYTETDAQGNTVTKTRTVTRTRWSHVNGEVRHAFDDVLVCASAGMPPQYALAVVPGKPEGLEQFRDEYLSGFQTERYTVGPGEGFNQAKQIMDAHIRELCRRDIGGDHQRLHSAETQHNGVTFKHILLPVWMTAYRFGEKTYRVLINGRTGHVVGDRPYSWVKILLLVVGILGFIAAFVALFMWLAK